MSNEVRGLILIRLKKKCTRFYSKETVQNVHLWAHVQRFLWKKNVSVTRRSVTNWKYVPVEGKRSTGQILTLWREIPGFRPALSYRISSAFLHIISVIGFKKPLHHLPSNAYQTFHNRLQPWELWEEPAFFSFFQINSGRDVNDSYCHHECKVKQVGAPSLRVS